MTDDGRFECPECNARYEYHVSNDGAQGCCPECGEQVRDAVLDPGQGQLDGWSG